MRLLAAAALVLALAGAAQAQAGCKLYKTFVPSATTSTIVVPDTLEVASVKVLGAAAGQLSHGDAPAAALPLAAGAFQGKPGKGEWQLSAAPGTAIPTWALVVCPKEGTFVRGQDDGSLRVATEVVNDLAANTTDPEIQAQSGPGDAPTGRGAVGYVVDKTQAVKQLKQEEIANMISYFTELSALKAQKLNDALTAAIDLVDKKHAAAQAAVTSLGGSLKSAAAGLRDGSTSLRDKIAGVEQAKVDAVKQKIEELINLAALVAGAAASSTSDAASVVGTAGELIKRKVVGKFKDYTTTEGMLKAQVNTLLAAKADALNNLVSAGVASLESIKAGKGPLLAKGVALKQAELEALGNALQGVAAAAQAMPTPSGAALKGFKFGQDALTSSMSQLLGSISKFHGMMGQVFPKVAQMAG